MEIVRSDRRHRNGLVLSGIAASDDLEFIAKQILFAWTCQFYKERVIPRSPLEASELRWKREAGSGVGLRHRSWQCANMGRTSPGFPLIVTRGKLHYAGFGVGSGLRRSGCDG